MLGRFFRWLSRVIEVCDALAPFVGGWPVIISFVLTGAAVIWGALVNMGPGIIPIAMLTLGVSAVATDELIRISKRIRRRVFERPALAQNLRELTATGLRLRDSVTGNSISVDEKWLDAATAWDQRVRKALANLPPGELYGYESIAGAFQPPWERRHDPHNYPPAWAQKAMAARVQRLRLITMRFLEKSKLKAGELFDEEEAKKT